MQLFVSKNNIRLHEGLFSSLEEAIAFAKKWLQENELIRYNNPSSYSGISQNIIGEVKWYVRNKPYYHTKQVLAKFSYEWHHPCGTFVYKKQCSVVINAKNNERLWGAE